MTVSISNDELREIILTRIYDQYKKARSRNSEVVGIRDLAQMVKEHRPEIKEQDVASNVAFLVKNELVEEVAIENYFAKKQFGGGKPTYKYRLSRDGLGYFEHGSKFDRSAVFAGIGDVTGNGNFIVIGNSNNITSVSNVAFVEGHKMAEDLRRRVNALGELDDGEKLSVQADIETIKSQLSKQKPDTTILSKAKENLGVLANVAAIAPYVGQLTEWLGRTFGI